MSPTVRSLDNPGGTDKKESVSTVGVAIATWHVIKTHRWRVVDPCAVEQEVQPFDRQAEEIVPSRSGRGQRHGNPFGLRIPKWFVGDEADPLGHGPKNYRGNKPNTSP